MEQAFPDLGTLGDAELRELIESLTEEEQEISYQRRVLHGKIDILRAELVNRLRQKRERGDSLISGDDVRQLTEILAGKAQSTGEPGDAS
jgi:hypothetical protein